MALHFLLDDPVAAGPGEVVVLTGAEAHHAAAVRRVRTGEEVTVGDGRRQIQQFIFTSLPGAVGDTFLGSINGGQ